MPEPYRKNVYFVIKKVDHSVSAAGWTTDIEAYMQFNPNEYTVEEKNEFPSIEETKLRQLFEYSSENIDFQDVIMNLSDTTNTRLQEYFDTIDRYLKQYETFKRLFFLKNNKYQVNQTILKQEYESISRYKHALRVLGITSESALLGREAFGVKYTVKQLNNNITKVGNNFYKIK